MLIASIASLLLVVIFISTMKRYNNKRIMIRSTPLNKFLDWAKITVWFLKITMQYMKGHSKWHIYTRLPKAYYNFMKSYKWN